MATLEATGRGISRRITACVAVAAAAALALAAPRGDLYPSHGAYVARVRTAALRAARAGFVLLPDARETVAEALAAPVP